MSDQIISKEGYEKLKKELEYLTTEKRREIAGNIQTAKDMGDLSENAEYLEAKDSQAFNEGRIAELTAILKNLTIVEDGHAAGIVGMGSKVLVEADGKEKEYTIVSFNEVNPLEGKISNESPLGRVLIGKKKGDKASVNLPKGTVVYKILKVD